MYILSNPELFFFLLSWNKANDSGALTYMYMKRVIYHISTVWGSVTGGRRWGGGGRITYNKVDARRGLL